MPLFQVTFLHLGCLYHQCKFNQYLNSTFCRLNYTMKKKRGKRRSINSLLIGIFISYAFRPTFRRIVRNGSTEQFSGLPYIYALLNCLICLWYGTPLISSDNLLLTTVNSVGAVFQFTYIIIFTIYAEKAYKVGCHF